MTSSYTEYEVWILYRDEGEIEFFAGTIGPDERAWEKDVDYARKAIVSGVSEVVITKASEAKA